MINTGHTSKSWTVETLKTASELWAGGMSTRDVAERMGVSKDAICGLTFRRRDLFPSRRQPEKKAVAVTSPLVPKLPAAITPRRPARADIVTRTTIGGAKVSMPRVTFIDGPEPGEAMRGAA